MRLFLDDEPHISCQEPYTKASGIPFCEFLTVVKNATASILEMYGVFGHQDSSQVQNLECTQEFYCKKFLVS